MSEQDTPIPNAVLYTDGGYRSQYQSGGWGVHGYTYLNAPPTKGTGNPKCIPTGTGYAPEKQPDAAVTVVSYIDGVGGIPNAVSSNETELHATVNGLRYAVEQKYPNIQMYSDSRYVVDSFNKWMSKWHKRGWQNAEGIPIKNKDLWLTAMELKEQLKAQKQAFTLSWIKGHAGHFGNEMADQYAKRGNVLGRKGSTFTFISETPSNGYWTKKSEYNRLLANGRWYFQTTDEAILTEQGESIYYIGDHGKEDDLVGKRNADNSMAVLYLKEPEPVLEKLRQQAMELDTKRMGSVMVGRLDTILNPTLYTELMEHGTLFLDWAPPHKNIVSHTKKPVLKEMAPAGLVYVQIDTLNNLQRKLDAYRSNDPFIQVTDITDLIYDLEQKKTSTVKKIKKTITQSSKYLDVTVNYSTALRQQWSNTPPPKVHEKTIRLILGLDIAKRNTLSSIANDEVVIKVITWRESCTVIRFATVIETTTGTGIWAGIDANYLMV